MFTNPRHLSKDVGRDNVVARLRRRMPGALRGAQPETPLTDLSIDSLDVVELLCVVDDEFGVRLEQRAFDEARTVGDLADRIAAGSAGAPPIRSQS